jgi:hypothetical protein
MKMIKKLSWFWVMLVAIVFIVFGFLYRDPISAYIAGKIPLDELFCFWIYISFFLILSAIAGNKAEHQFEEFFKDLGISDET